MKEELFWIERYEKASEMILTQRQITHYNKLVLHKLKKTGEMFDLKENFEKNVKFGICIKRSDLRTDPSDAFQYGEDKDDYLDMGQISAVLMNEPLIILKEDETGAWYYVRTYFAEGWMRKHAIAVCKNREQMEQAAYGQPFLTVTADRFCLPQDRKRKAVSGLELYMGTRILLAAGEAYCSIVGERAVTEQFIVKIPLADKNGALYYEKVLLPFSKDVSMGYIEYTTDAILRQAFKMLGNPYGWGGSMKERDCSSMIMELFRCFGIFLPRNSSAQGRMPARTIELSKKDVQQKRKVLNVVPPGAVLYMPGHVMLYLGCVEGKYYVISAAGGYTPYGGLKRIPVRAVTVNDLSVCKSDGKSWMQALEKVKVVK